jgi:hypothetical protein
MANTDITHLEIHKGKTKRIRAQEAAPTSPTPETGDVYYDTTPGVEALGIYIVNAWIYVSTQL